MSKGPHYSAAEALAPHEIIFVNATIDAIAALADTGENGATAMVQEASEGGTVVGAAGRGQAIH